MKRILFQGDSITDCGRRDEFAPYGDGYVKMVADVLLAGDNVEIINRGVSGDRIKELRVRWEEDCINLKPDVLSLLVGINDCWRKYDSNDETPVETFEDYLDRLLTRTKAETNAKIILMEPFSLPIAAYRVSWRVTLDPIIHAVRRMAMKHADAYVPLDGLFAKWALEFGYEPLSADGVHPLEQGHKMIKEAWLEAYHTL